MLSGHVRPAWALQPSAVDADHVFPIKNAIGGEMVARYSFCGAHPPPCCSLATAQDGRGLSSCSHILMRIPDRWCIQMHAADCPIADCRLGIVDLDFDYRVDTFHERLLMPEAYM